MKVEFPVLALLFLLSGGCSLIPELQSSEDRESPVPDALPASSSADAVSSAENENEEKLGWREFYQAEELKQLIEKSLENNRDFKNAILNVEQVRASYGIQRNLVLPDIDVSGGYRRQKIPPNALNFGAGGGGTAELQGAGGAPEGFLQEQYSLNVGITSYELDLFGRVRSLNESALEEFFASEYAMEGAKIALISEVALAYLRLLADRELEELAKKTVKAQEETVGIIQKRFEAGVSSELDLRQAQTLLENARADASAFSRRVAMDMNALELLAGTSLSEKEFDAVFESASGAMKPLNIGLESSQLLRRPDIQRAERLLRAANADIGAARAAFFPSISLTTTAGKLSTEAADLFEEDSNSWLFFPQINLPIFTGGRNKARLELAQLRKEARIVEYEAAIQNAFREVSDALVSNEKISDQLDSVRRALEAAEKAYRLSKLRYEAGVDSYLTELDALRSLYAARRTYINQRLNYFSNLAALYRALGGGAR